ncbi:MAG: hypothetical protein HRU28_05965 [Rhizobiales bacterium]|nr:hypothetical protein [Hyphomicrobiales bacterium]
MFKAIHLILGANAAEGKSKTTGKPYSYGRLYQPTSFFDWDNENGRGVSSGVKTPEDRDAMKCTAEMMDSLASVELPAFLELSLVPSEDDIKELICESFKVVSYIPIKHSEFEALYSKKPTSLSKSS